MNAVLSFLGGQACHNLLMALAHTLWQGLLVAGLLYAYLRAVPAEAANRRYAAGAISLLAIVLAGLLTWSVLNYTPAQPAQATADSAEAIRSPEPPDESPSGAPRVAGVSPARAEGILPSRQGGDARDTTWQGWLTGLWLVGVAAMLLRALAVMMGGGRLQRRCVPVESEAVLALVEQLRQRMHIGRRIRVVIGEHLSVPGVVGCVWPTLLLPVSLVSGVPADDLQAILAHELAHIKRFDYLVNFGQMIVEALLFFNPAVWWVSRQIRIEREACCDLAGVALTGRKTQYAETLVSWAQRLRDQHAAGAPAIAFADGKDEGSLLDRVRRIVVAGHRPRLRVSWPVAVAMLLLTALVLIGLWQGTDLAVALAGKMLSPQERVEAINEISQQYGYEDREYGPEDKVLVSGTVRTYDGSAFSEEPRVMLRSDRPRYGASAGIAARTEGQPTGVATFSFRAQYGRIYVTADAKGYAPGFAGPFDPKPAGTIDGIELVLTEGFPAQVHVIDEQGSPIEGAEIVGGYVYPENGSYHHTIRLTTDPNGIARQEHAVEHPAGLHVEADGFEPEQIRGVTFREGQATSVMLHAVAPISGTVRAAATGAPIAGAAVRLLISRAGDRSYSETDIQADPDAVTAADGRFVLPRLRNDRVYLMLVQADGYAREYVNGVRPGDTDLSIALGPKRAIRGQVIGALDRLERNEEGTPVIKYENGYRFGNDSWTGYPETALVRIEDGVGHFEIADFYGQTVRIIAGGQRVSVDVERDDLGNVTLALQPLSDTVRQVVLNFNAPTDSPPIQGSVRIDYVPEGERGYKPDWIEIAGGQARCEVPVPCRFKYSIDYYRGMRPVGYWFDESEPVEIPVADEPFAIEVPIHPAGAIYGRVLLPDGTVAADASAYLMVAEKPEVVGTATYGLGNALHGPGMDRGRFNATPLPLGGEYVIVAYAGNRFRVTEPLRLDAADPIIERDIQLVEGVTLTGRLLDADGRPARDLVRLGVSVKKGRHNWGTRRSEIRPDENGYFAFENLDPDFEGRYIIYVSVRPGYQPVEYEVRDVEKSVIIQLETFERLTGVVIDAETGWPVPGAEVEARYEEGGLRRALEAEGRTNERGEFVFNNMTARRYRLVVQDATLLVQQSTYEVTGGQTSPALLRVRIPHHSDLKPQPPQGSGVSSSLADVQHPQR